MAASNHPPGRTTDPLLQQAETILAQRQARAQVIDRDLIGEPAWDLLLYAFISLRKGEVCNLHDAAREIDLSLATTTRWVNLLVERRLFVRREGFFAISEEAEAKLSDMFRQQLKEVAQAMSAGSGQTVDHPRRMT